MAAIGRRVRALRQQRQLLLEALAERSGVSMLSTDRPTGRDPDTPCIYYIAMDVAGGCAMIGAPTLPPLVSSDV